MQIYAFDVVLLDNLLDFVDDIDVAASPPLLGILPLGVNVDRTK